MSNPFTRKDALTDVINQVVLGEKKLTDAEKNKREEIAQAIERDNPGMDMGKKMAIATAQAKKVAEDVEQVDEPTIEEGSFQDPVPDWEYQHARSQLDAKAKELDAIKRPKSQAAHNRALGRMKNTAVSKFLQTRKGDGKVRTEEVDLDEASEKDVAKALTKTRGERDLRASELKPDVKTGSFAQRNPEVTKKLLGKAETEYGKALKDVKKTPVSKFLQTRKGDGKVRTEEVEQIDELSKGTLGSYVKKAAKDVEKKTYWKDRFDHIANMGAGPLRYDRKMSAKRQKEIDSRHKNIGKAVDRLTKEEVEPIDEISQLKLANYVAKAATSLHNNAKEAGQYDDKENANKAFKRWLGIKSAAVRLRGRGELPGKESAIGAYPKMKYKTEEVDQDEDLEMFLEEYTTMFNEAEDTQQLMLLRAMAQDPSELMKMKRALNAGDKAMTNPVLRGEILKMLDQMMKLTTTDKSLLQKTRAGFQKAKSMPEEVQQEAKAPKKYKFVWNKVGTKKIKVPVKEDVESLDEQRVIDMKGKTCTKCSKGKYGKDHPDDDDHYDDLSCKSCGHKTERYTTLLALAQKKKKTNEEVEQIDELSKKKLKNYITKATDDKISAYSHDYRYHDFSDEEPSRDHDQDSKDYARAEKREKGIDLARAKVNKSGKSGRAIAKVKANEEIQIDELSKATLGSYIKKASDKATQHANVKAQSVAAIHYDSKGNPVAKFHGDMKNKRLQGIAKATDKLTKEEVELIDEAKKTTHEDPLITVHKDGRLHAHAHLSTINDIHGTDVKHTAIHAGGAKVKTKYGDNLEYKLSRHHAKGVQESVVNEEMRSPTDAEYNIAHKYMKKKANSSDLALAGIGVHPNGNIHVHIVRKDFKGAGSHHVISKEGHPISEEADKTAPFEGGRETTSKTSAAERVKKIAKGMKKQYTKDKK